MDPDPTTREAAVTAAIGLDVAGEDGGSGTGFERAAALVVLRRGRGVGKKRREVVKPMAGSTLGCSVGTARGLAAELIGSRELRRVRVERGEGLGPSG